MNLRLITRKEVRKIDGKTNVKIALTHRGKIRYIGTDVHILPDQFDEKDLVINHPEARQYNIELRDLLQDYERKLVKKEREARNWQINRLLEYLKGDTVDGEEADFFFRANNYIERLREEGRIAYANNLLQTYNDVKEFNRSSVLEFEDIDKSWLDKYKRHRTIKGSSVNTIAVHLRNIRTFYNEAIKADAVDLGSYPFRDYVIQTQRGQHRDLTAEEVRIIAEMEDLTWNEKRVRDLWLLSFCLCGINYADLLTATHENIHRGRLEYIRQKTERRKKELENISVKILPPARKLLNKYAGKKFLLSFIEERPPVKPYKEDSVPRPPHKDLVDYSNKVLKRIGTKAELDVKLSTYYARHSWASIAFNECGVSEDVISYALGHSSPRAVTARYIHKKNPLVDEANEKVLALVFSQNSQKK